MTTFSCYWFIYYFLAANACEQLFYFGQEFLKEKSSLLIYSSWLHIQHSFHSNAISSRYWTRKINLLYSFLCYYTYTKNFSYFNLPPKKFQTSGPTHEIISIPFIMYQKIPKFSVDLLTLNWPGSSYHWFFREDTFLLQLKLQDISWANFTPS